MQMQITAVLPGSVVKLRNPPDLHQVRGIF